MFDGKDRKGNEWIVEIWLSIMSRQNFGGPAPLAFVGTHTYRTAIIGESRRACAHEANWQVGARASIGTWIVAAFVATIQADLHNLQKASSRKIAQSTDRATLRELAIWRNSGDIVTISCNNLSFCAPT